MNSIMDELYHADLTERLARAQTKEHKRCAAEHTAAVDRFRQTLGRRQLKALDAILDQSVDLTGREVRAYFRVGFCFGVRLLLEALGADLS